MLMARDRALREKKKKRDEEERRRKKFEGVEEKPDTGAPDYFRWFTLIMKHYHAYTVEMLKDLPYAELRALADHAMYEEKLENYHMELKLMSTMV